MTRVAILCCHLSGTGHLVRMLALARALAAAGAKARLISGGRPLGHVPVEDVDLVQLPPLVVRDLDFSTLRCPEGMVADGAYLGARREALLAALDGFRPEALVTELFPLGRRRLAPEFLAAIQAVRAATPRAAIIASVRDVPEPPRKPERFAEAAARLETDYDALLVHGAEEVLPLSVSWPLAGPRPPVIHTGYVADPAPPAPPPSGAVIVSGGGGALGDRLARLAAEAAALGTRPWHVLTGGPHAAATAAAIAASIAAETPGAPLTLEPARADYRALLAGAACSVSLAGYNTVTDLAQVSTPAILVPFAEAGEREQTIRAEAFSGFPGVRVMAAGGLTPRALSAAAEALAAGPRRPLWPLPLDGATRSAEAILRVAATRQAA